MKIPPVMRNDIHQGDMVKFRQYIELLWKMHPPLKAANGYTRQPLTSPAKEQYEIWRTNELGKIWKSIKIIDGEMYWMGPVVNWEWLERS